MEEAVVADSDFCDSVVTRPTSTCLKNTGLIVDLTGGVTVGVSFPDDLAGYIIVAGDVAGWYVVPGRPRWRCHCRCVVPG